MDYSRNKQCVLAIVAGTMFSSAIAQPQPQQTQPEQPPPSLRLMQNFQGYTPLGVTVQQPGEPGTPPPAEPTIPLTTKPVVPLPAMPRPSVNSSVLPSAQEPPLNANLTNLNGIVILGSYQDFKAEGTGDIRGIDIEGPAFLKSHKPMVSAWVGDFLGKSLGLNALDRLQTYLILACRQLDRPMVDVYYPEQEIVNGVVQVVIYEGKIGHIEINRLNRSSTFTANEIKDMPGFVKKLREHPDPVSAFLWGYKSKKLNIFQTAVAGSNQVNAVVQALNNVIEGTNIYEVGQFKGVKLRPETMQLAKASPAGSDVANLNRLLLEDAYPKEFSRKHFGRKWFSDAYLTEHIHLKPGQSISQKKLLEDVEKLNRDTQFLEVNAFYKQAKFDENNSGSTDIGLTVKERFPLRVYTGYDNYGIKVLEENQVYGGFNYGNLFGVADQLNYQYTTDIEFSHLQAHTASFVDPLPWGDTFTIFGGYNSVNGDLSKIEPLPHLANSGYSYQIGLRYLVPLPHWGGLDHALTAGYDFKSADTGIQYGQAFLSTNAADIDQFVLGYRARLPDRLGYSQIDVNGFYSPGGLLGRNTDSDFSSFHSGLNLKADYYYGKIEGERVFYLPWGLWLLGKGGYQNTSTGLLPSEELYLGGHTLLRGYSEDIESGDQGYYATVELHSPLISTGNLTGQKNLPGQPDGDALDIYWFYDYGAVDRVAPNLSPYVSLDSAGAGLSYHISRNLKADVAYGFELDHNTPQAVNKGHSRAHIDATLAY